MRHLNAALEAIVEEANISEKVGQLSYRPPGFKELMRIVIQGLIRPNRVLNLGEGYFREVGGVLL